MSKLNPLFIDADLELVYQGESRIKLQLESGQGVVKLTDAILLRKLIKQFLVNRQSRSNLHQILGLSKYVPSKIDIWVAGKTIARVDTELSGGLLERLTGLPGLQIRPVALLSALFK